MSLNNSFWGKMLSTFTVSATTVEISLSGFWRVSFGERRVVSCFMGKFRESLLGRSCAYAHVLQKSSIKTFKKNNNLRFCNAYGRFFVNNFFNKLLKRTFTNKGYFITWLSFWMPKLHIFFGFILKLGNLKNIQKQSTLLSYENETLNIFLAFFNPLLHFRFFTAQ